MRCRLPRPTLPFAPATLGLALLATAAAAQSTTRVSVASGGGDGNGSSFLDRSALSADGQVVAFASAASNLVAGDTNATEDVFVLDRATGLTTRVSVDSNGAQVKHSGGIVGLSLSADGRIVAFGSDSPKLVAGDSNGSYDVFVHDRATGLTERISVDSAGVEGDSDSFFPSGVSADGRCVAFDSYATNLVAGDGNDDSDVFVRDRAAGTTTRVSVGSAGVEGDGFSRVRSMSGDGTIVAFESNATNLVAGDANGMTDVFVHDRATGATQRVSVGPAGLEADDESGDATLSSDGLLVAFSSRATNLVAGDANLAEDVFLHDRATGLTERVSVDANGAEANSSCRSPALSGDGRFVVFRSAASNLVAGDGNGVDDLFVRELATGAIERASVDSAGGESNGVSRSPSLSANGSVVAFSSQATNLVAGDGNAANDVFLRERCVAARWANYGAGFAGTNGIPAFTAQSDPELGTTVTLDLGNSAGTASAAWVVVGYSAASVPSSKGGTFLVANALVLVVPLPAGGATLGDDVPDDEALCGLELFLQALELDPGAAKGVSFTPGLQLVLGR